ncbi:MAG: flagellar protein FliS [Anaerolineales bacterium]|jgi:flagellin-specific chaperone FliS|nr:flagellar protein FliS [Anaerolineales bacterium]
MYNAFQAKYREQDVMNASPIHLVVMVYDVAISACEDKDLDRASRALSVLRDSLNFDYAESAGLFRLYQWIMECVRNDDYENAMSTLRELRDAWSTVESRLSGLLPTIETTPSTSSPGAQPAASTGTGG